MTFAADALAGRTLLVTGAGSGLGRATAALAARCGARVIGVGRDEAKLNLAVDALDGEGHAYRLCDLADADAAAALVSEVSTGVGGLDGLFHAAGSGLILPTRLTKPNHLQSVFGAAVNGLFGLARSAAKSGVMKEGASLVFMSSVSAHRGRAGMAAYAGAKAAVEGATRSLAIELAPRGVRVNALAAGGVHTPMNDRAVANLPGAAADAYAAAHPLGLGQPEDVAAAAVFLLSPAARWVTGTTLIVDGGYAA